MNTQTHPNIEWSEVVLLSFVYALYLLLITAPIGFVISAVKVYRFKRAAEQGRQGRAPSQETVLVATHHEWLVRSFIGLSVLAMVSLGTMYYMFGFIVAAAAVVWWLYRLGKGIAALIAYREMPAPVCTKAQCYGQVTPV